MEDQGRDRKIYGRKMHDQKIYDKKMGDRKMGDRKMALVRCRAVRSVVAILPLVVTPATCDFCFGFRR